MVSLLGDVRSMSKARFHDIGVLVLARNTIKRGL